MQKRRQRRGIGAYALKNSGFPIPEGEREKKIIIDVPNKIERKDIFMRIKCFMFHKPRHIVFLPF